MSKDEKPIHYEPHPVSAERKAELIAKGVRIVDAAYAPADDGRVPESDERKVLIAELQAKGVQFDEAMPIDELRALSITPADAKPANPKQSGRVKAAKPADAKE